MSERSSAIGEIDWSLAASYRAREKHVILRTSARSELVVEIVAKQRTVSSSAGQARWEGYTRCCRVDYQPCVGWVAVVCQSGRCDRICLLTISIQLIRRAVEYRNFCKHTPRVLFSALVRQQFCEQHREKERAGVRERGMGSIAM